MKKHAALVSFVLNLDLFAAEQVESFIDDLTIHPAGRATGTAGKIAVCEMDYTSTINIERYPHKAKPAHWLFGQLSAWLIDNDDDRTEGYEFTVDVEILDDDTADVEIRIEFSEIVTASENPAGALLLTGDRYRFDD